MVKVHLLHPYYYPKAVVFSEVTENREGKKKYKPHISYQIFR
jgi:hypothetical protein